MLIEKIHISKLREAPYNPRRSVRDDKALYEKLKGSLEAFGYIDPIIWNQRTGNVVHGHQRLQVLRDGGLEEIEVVVVDFDEVKEKAANIALNKISGDFDHARLADLLRELDSLDKGMLARTGFSTEELDRFIGDLPQFREKDYDESIPIEVIEVECPCCHAKFKV